jgi:hypothetical protein
MFQPFQYIFPYRYPQTSCPKDGTSKSLP